MSFSFFKPKVLKEPLMLDFENNGRKLDDSTRFKELNFLLRDDDLADLNLIIRLC